MTDVDLIELLRLDSEVAVELAETSADIAAALLEELEQTNRQLDIPRSSGFAWGRRSPDAHLPPGQPIGGVNPATLRTQDRRVIECATHSTRAATNYLLLKQVEVARELYSQAAGLVEVYSTDDSTVLKLCARPFAALDFIAVEGASAPSPWLRETYAGIVAGLTGQVRPRDDFPAAFSGSSPAPAGTSAIELQQLRTSLASSKDATRAKPLLRQLDDVVARTSSRLLPAMQSHWWATQDVAASPIEPELLVLAVLSECWHLRFAPREDEEVTWALDAAPDNALATALHVAAHRLLLDDAPARDFDRD